MRGGQTRRCVVCTPLNRASPVHVGHVHRITWAHLAVESRQTWGHRGQQMKTLNGMGAREGRNSEERRRRWECRGRKPGGQGRTREVEQRDGRARLSSCP